MSKATISRVELAAWRTIIKGHYTDKLQSLAKTPERPHGLTKKQIGDMTAGFEEGTFMMFSTLCCLELLENTGAHPTDAEVKEAIAAKEAARLGDEATPAQSGEKETYTKDEVREIEHQFRENWAICENKKTALVLQVRGMLDEYEAMKDGELGETASFQRCLQGLQITVGRGA